MLSIGNYCTNKYHDHQVRRTRLDWTWITSKGRNRGRRAQRSRSLLWNLSRHWRDPSDRSAAPLSSKRIMSIKQEKWEPPEMTSDPFFQLKQWGQYVTGSYESSLPRIRYYKQNVHHQRNNIHFYWLCVWNYAYSNLVICEVIPLSFALLGVDHILRVLQLLNKDFQETLSQTILYEIWSKR